MKFLLKATWLFVTLFWLNGCQKAYENDIRNDGKQYWLTPEITTKLQAGKSREEDIYRTIGRQPTLRMSFDPVLPVKRFDKYYPVDRIIIYRAWKFDEKKEQKGKYIRRSTVTTESMVVLFYLYNAKLSWLSIDHIGVVGPDGNHPTRRKWAWLPDTTADIIAANKMTHQWPDAPCHQEFYDIMVLKNRKHVLGGGPCYWMAADFERQLEKSGYFERLTWWDRHFHHKIYDEFD